MDSTGKMLLFCTALILLQGAAFWAGNAQARGYDPINFGTENSTDPDDSYSETINFPEYSGMEIVRTKNSVIAKKGGEELFLTGGSPVRAVYFADLNGDRVREMIAEISTGGSDSNEVVVVYDFELKSHHTLDEPKRNDFYASMEDGKIIVKKVPHNNPDGYSTTGELKLTADGLSIG